MSCIQDVDMSVVLLVTRVTIGPRREVERELTSGSRYGVRYSVVGKVAPLSVASDRTIVPRNNGGIR